MLHNTVLLTHIEIYGDIRYSLIGIRYTYMVYRVCYGPSLSWADFAMGRVVQLPKNGLSVADPRLYIRTCMKVFEYIPNLRRTFTRPLIIWFIKSFTHTL